MSKYHPFAEEIPTFGRVLAQPEGLKTTLATLRQLLELGEVLVGYYDAEWHAIAPALESQRNIDELYRQYLSGSFTTVVYYAVPEERLRLQ